MRCIVCGRDINVMGMDNVSPYSDFPLCEECVRHMDFRDFYDYCKSYETEWTDDNDDRALE